jgi:lipopolysaccharide/colanic/teichoic acid biosynthesis glycosyltransferase
MTAARLGVPPGVPRRALDLLVTGSALVLLLPLLVFAAVLVMVSSRGPVIFRQQRVGQGGIPFTLLKFRTMRTGSSGPAVTPAGDDRLTPVGKLLRMMGLDELPQLINILKGEMTLVGPRPETLDLATRYPAGCDAVFAHRPGLTGPAAVRLRDRDELRSPTDAVEEYYLEVVVPAKVNVDLDFLASPTVVRTLGVMVETFLYILSGGRIRRAVTLAKPTARITPAPKAHSAPATSVPQSAQPDRVS